MTFTVDERGDSVAIVRGTGRLNMVTGPELRDVVSRVVASGRNRVVADLSQIELMDSSGLGALIGCLKTARENGGDLRIAGVRDELLMVLRLSTVDRILKPYDDPETAFDA
ncbi:STAS domain-containing protein [Gryllotalpicola ginsengisoli]|uniref:STAS domain-containing protein n=1 Tax=Gryllotalpicola ginsengisoli TaxID=444608 RepID=UPI0003B752DC|nr:STAS domain-containing protein [Gryllotalpicola ginsengisoli]